MEGRIKNWMLRIRPFVPRDLPEVDKVISNSLKESYTTSFYISIHNSWRDGFLVAEYFGKLVGVLAGIISGKSRGRILIIAVEKNYRYRGIGTSLMKAFMEHCALNGIREIELEVRKSNATAIRFYTRLGFEISGIIRGFYTDGEDGLRMLRAF